MSYAAASALRIVIDERVRAVNIAEESRRTVAMALPSDPPERAEVSDRNRDSVPFRNVDMTCTIELTAATAEPVSKDTPDGSCSRG